MSLFMTCKVRERKVMEGFMRTALADLSPTFELEGDTNVSLYVPVMHDGSRNTDMYCVALYHAADDAPDSTIFDMFPNCAFTRYTWLR